MATNGKECKLLGEISEKHGNCTFYTGFECGHYVSYLGQFFLVKPWIESKVCCVAELKMLWHDETFSTTFQDALVNLRLYMLPENTAIGRMPYQHGQDEVIAVTETVILKLNNLLKWMEGAQYAYLKWPGVNVFDHDFDWKFGLTNEDSIFATKYVTPIAVLSFSRYCRLRAKLAANSCHDIKNCAAKMIKVLFCRDTLELPELEDHPLLCNHMMPKINVQARSKRSTAAKKEGRELSANKRRYKKRKVALLTKGKRSSHRKIAQSKAEETKPVRAAPPRKSATSKDEIKSIVIRTIPTTPSKNNAGDATKTSPVAINNRAGTSKNGPTPARRNPLAQTKNKPATEEKVKPLIIPISRITCGKKSVASVSASKDDNRLKPPFNSHQVPPNSVKKPAVTASSNEVKPFSFADRQNVARPQQPSTANRVPYQVNTPITAKLPPEKKTATDEKYDSRRKAFNQDLLEFMRNRQTPITRIPCIGYQEINLYEFFAIVQSYGGFAQVSLRHLWTKVFEELGGDKNNASAASLARIHYHRLLLPYEHYMVEQMKNQLQKDQKDTAKPPSNQPLSLNRKVSTPSVSVAMSSTVPTRNSAPSLIRNAVPTSFRNVAPSLIRNAPPNPIRNIAPNASRSAVPGLIRSAAYTPIRNSAPGALRNYGTPGPMRNPNAHIPVVDLCDDDEDWPHKAVPSQRLNHQSISQQGLVGIQKQRLSNSLKPVSTIDVIDLSTSPPTKRNCGVNSRASPDTPSHSTPSSLKRLGSGVQVTIIPPHQRKKQHAQPPQMVPLSAANRPQLLMPPNFRYGPNSSVNQLLASAGLFNNVGNAHEILTPNVLTAYHRAMAAAAQQLSKGNTK